MTTASAKRNTRSRAKAKPEETLAVVADNIKEEPKGIAESSDTVCIACALGLGLKFDDVPDGKGGTKTIIFPGVNQFLRGEKGGILVDRGHAVAVTILKKDWEAIKRMHGREDAFVGVNGQPPCLIEMKSADEFNARKNEIVSEMSTGLEAADPADVGVRPTDMK